MKARGVDIAAACSVHPVTVSAWRRGENIPPDTKLPALAFCLQVSLESLQAEVAEAKAARRQPFTKDAAGSLVP